MAAHMDMVTLHRAMQDLLAANECEAAAQLDLRDAEAALEFHKRKVQAMADRFRDMKAKAEKAQGIVAQIVAMETAAPLAMMEAIGE